MTEAAGVRAGVVFGASLGLAGLVLGGLWWKISPVSVLVVRADDVYYNDPVATAAVGADARFALLSLGFGLIAGVLGWVLLRRHDMPAVVALGVGGLVAAVIAARTGTWLGRVDVDALRAAPVGTLAHDNLKMSVMGLLMVVPASALGAWLLLDLISDFRARNEPPEIPVVPAWSMPSADAPPPPYWPQSS